MKIKKEGLLLLAGAVWAIAGANILRIGLSCLFEAFSQNIITVFLLMILLASIIFTGFIMMFKKVVKRNTKRILSYSDKKSVFAVFDAKGYFLMLFMMGLGITLRSINLLPTAFFAVFYTGLGTALTLAGCLFIINYFNARSVKRDPNETA